MPVARHYARLFPRILAAEIPLKQGLLLSVVGLSFCLSVSALDELLEWAPALAMGQGADALLGTQGDSWQPSASAAGKTSL